MSFRATSHPTKRPTRLPVGMMVDGTVPVGKTHHISILLQDREPDAGDLDGEQNARSDAGDARANDGDLDVRKSHSLQI